MVPKIKTDIYTIAFRASEELVDTFKVVTDWHGLNQSAMLRRLIWQESDRIKKEPTRSHMKPPKPWKLTVFPLKT